MESTAGTLTASNDASDPALSNFSLTFKDFSFLILTVSGFDNLLEVPLLMNTNIHVRGC